MFVFPLVLKTFSLIGTDVAGFFLGTNQYTFWLYKKDFLVIREVLNRHMIDTWSIEISISKLLVLAYARKTISEVSNPKESPVTYLKELRIMFIFYILRKLYISKPEEDHIYYMKTEIVLINLRQAYRKRVINRITAL